MSNYTKATDFAAKDSLPSGDAAKVIKGAEFEDEFDAIATAVNSKSDTASPTFTGTVTIPTAAVTTFNLGGVVVTSTASELNILDGATATTTEINYLDGVTSNIQTQLNTKGTVSSLSDLSVTATATELNYVDGVTSNIQTQLDAKAPTTSPTFTGTVTVPGLTTTGNVSFGDNDKAMFGAGNDLQIYHTGTGSYVEDAGGGNLIFKTNGNGFFFEDINGDQYISAITANKTARLHYDNNIKLSTDLNGITVTGDTSTDTLTLGLWNIKVDTNELVFVYNGTEVFKLGTNGAVTSANNITAFGTI